MVILEIRAVHGSGGSGFCPTRNRPVTVREGGFSTRNRLVIVTDSLVRVAVGWWSVLGETDLIGILQNAARSRQIRRDLARSIQDPVRSRRIR